MAESSDPEDVMFTAYGRAMSRAQDYEGQLLNLSLLVGAHAQGGFGTPGLSDMDRRLSKKTLGALLHWLEAGGYVERSMHAVWFEALRIRNDLAHRFFLDRVELLASRKGHLDVARELENADDVLYRARNEVSSVIPQVLHALGVDVAEFMASAAAEQQRILGSE